MVHYIDKDALVAEIEKRRSRNSKNKLFLAAAIEDNYLLSFIDDLEVKEVDLEKEWKEFLKDGDVGFKEIAKHFFELGIKAQKGEKI